jgi:hypothetical protein
MGVRQASDSQQPKLTFAEVRKYTILSKKGVQSFKRLKTPTLHKPMECDWITGKLMPVPSDWKSNFKFGAGELLIRLHSVS